MLFKFAFRNVMRNRKRSLLTASSILVAAFVVVMVHGFINGVIDMYFQNYIKYQTGNFRITTAEFIKKEKFVPVDRLVGESDKLIGQLRKLNGIDLVEERIKFGIILGKEDKSIYSFGMGINLENTKFELKKKIIKGKMTGNGIYIGKGLAEKLGLKIGDDLLIATQTSEGGLNGIKLRVNGIFQFNMNFDTNMFFISTFDAKRLLKIKGETTEIIIYTKRGVNEGLVKNDISKFLSKGIVAESMKEQLKDFYGLFILAKYIYYIIEALIVMLASFVVINTIMMSIFERIREIGTLKALGMRNKDIFRNFTYEGAIIGIFGGTIGAALGYGVLFLLKDQGINIEFAMEGFAMPMEYIIRPSVGIDVIIFTIIISVSISSMAAMFPSKYASKLLPAEALRKN